MDGWKRCKSSWQLGCTSFKHLAMFDASSQYFDRVAKAKRTLQSSKTRALEALEGGLCQWAVPRFMAVFTGENWWLTMLNYNFDVFSMGKMVFIYSKLQWMEWQRPKKSLFLGQRQMGDRCPILPLILILGSWNCGQPPKSETLMSWTKTTSLALLRAARSPLDLVTVHWCGSARTGRSKMTNTALRCRSPWTPGAFCKWCCYQDLPLKRYNRNQLTKICIGKNGVEN